MINDYDQKALDSMRFFCLKGYNAFLLNCRKKMINYIYRKNKYLSDLFTEVIIKKILRIIR